MSAVFRRSRARGWILAAAAVFGTTALALVVAIARIDRDALFAPAILVLAGVPLAAAGRLGLLARRAFRHRPEVVAIDAVGVTLAGGPVLRWSELGQVIVTTTLIGYGPLERITLRRRFTPSEIAAKSAERLVHNLFTDRGFARADVDQSTEAMLAEIDAGLTTAGHVRAEPPYSSFRLLQSARRLHIRPADTRI